MAQMMFCAVSNSCFRYYFEQCMYVAKILLYFIFDCIYTKRNLYSLFSQRETTHLASRFSLTLRYSDDVLSINPEFENYLDQMYSAELEIKDTTESIISTSYLDLLLLIGRDFPNLCLFSTFHLDHPSVRSRFCFVQGQFSLRFSLAIFALWPESELKSGLIEWCTSIKDFIPKSEIWRIQDLVNQLSIFVRRKIRLGEFKLVCVENHNIRISSYIVVPEPHCRRKQDWTAFSAAEDRLQIEQ